MVSKVDQYRPQIPGLHSSSHRVLLDQQQERQLITRGRSMSQQIPDTIGINHNLLRPKNSASNYDLVYKRNGQLKATMPSVQNQIEQQQKMVRSRSLSYGPALLQQPNSYDSFDYYRHQALSEEEQKLVYREETTVFTLTDKSIQLFFFKLSPEEIQKKRQQNRKKGISSDILLDRYQSSKNIRQSRSSSSSGDQEDDDESVQSRAYRMIRSNIAQERYDLVKWLPEAVKQMGRHDTIRFILPYLPKYTQDKIQIKRQLLSNLWTFILSLLPDSTQDERQVVFQTTLQILFDFLLDTQQKFKELSYEILIKISQQMNQDQCNTHLLKTIIQLSHNEADQDARITALQLSNQLSYKMGKETCQSYLTFQIISKADQPSHRIRKAAAMNLVNICSNVQQDFFIQKLYPAFLKLATDQTWGVRKAAIESLPDIAKLCPIRIRATELVDLFLKLSKDPNKWVKLTAYQYLGQFIASLENKEAVNPVLIEHFLSMGYSQKWASKNQIYYYCAFNFPAVLYTLGKGGWISMRKLFFQLAKSTQWKVRRTIAYSIHEIAKILGPDDAQAQLLNVLHYLLKDLSDVRIGALTNLPKFLEAMRSDRRNQFLDLIQDLQNQPQDWRMRALLAKQVQQYASLFEPEKVFAVLTPILLKHCNDAVSQVRICATDSVYKILEVLENSPFFFNSVVNNIKVMAKSKSYKNRQSFLHICKNLMLVPRIFTDYFLQSLFLLVKDKVVNVRITLAKLIKNYESENNQSGELMKYFHSIIQTLQKDINREVRFIMHGDHIDYPSHALIDPNSQRSTMFTSSKTNQSFQQEEEFDDMVQIVQEEEVKEEQIFPSSSSSPPEQQQQEHKNKIIQSLVTSMIDSIVDDQPLRNLKKQKNTKLDEQLENQQQKDQEVLSLIAKGDFE